MRISIGPDFRLAEIEKLHEIWMAARNDNAETSLELGSTKYLVPVLQWLYAANRSQQHGQMLVHSSIHLNETDEGLITRFRLRSIIQ